ncbi:DNA polymerase III subunit beta [Winkia sp. UMB3158]|uniref:DNA polymerase III subunit beta n=1 Tax=Winkia sp. UMB3158 TaxID=3046333 RepID=UPI0025569D60|nr:DNA polymerase III subunit beta [Winkia sp. UMB3158]MDK7148893.1 DNA polymerase III subunit beta [Winkia sp. UMB3158]
MKFRVDCDVLADAVTWTARTLPQRPAVPVLAGVRLTTEGSIVVLSSFDYETSARSTIEAQVDEDGEVLVSGRLLADICKALPAKPVDVVLDGPKVRIQCGSSKFSLLTMPLDDYPALPAVPPVVGTIDSADFSQAVSQVAVAASRDDTLPLLTTINCEINGDTLTMLATDRYRLAQRDIKWNPSEGSLQVGALVRSKMLTDMTKSLSGGGEVKISLSTESGSAAILAMEQGGRRMTSQLTDGDYPQVRRLFPENTSIHAVVDRVELQSALKRVSLVAERNTAVRLTLEPGQLTLEAGQGEDAQAREDVPLHLDGEPIVTAFNPHYLLDGLNAIDDPYVKMSFNHPSKPAVLTGQEEPGAGEDTSYRYLLMPIRYGI